MPYKNKSKKKEYNNKYYQENKEKLKEDSRRYVKENKEEVRRKSREYYQLHKNERRENERLRKKKYYENNKKSESRRKKKYYENNKEKIEARGKIYRENNKEKIKATHKTWYQLNKKEINKKVLVRRNSNILLRFKCNVSAIVRGKLNRRLISKKGKATFTFLPYTIDELIQHLEKLFLPGMSWENYGFYGWHIDHKVADCKFSYKSVEDKKFQECWALKNLQPLWAEENWKKNRF